MRQHYAGPIKVGSLVTGYEKGIHRVLSIGKLGVCASSYLVSLERVLDSAYRPRKGRSQCDMYYCELVNIPDLISRVEHTHKDVVENLKGFL